jgi:hypothetical protein
MITVYLGDIYNYLVELACKTDPDAKLITKENYKNLLPGTYYTSIADVDGLLNLSVVLRSADQIVYAPPPNGIWSDQKNGTSTMQTWTEDYLKIFRFRTSVKNFSVKEVSNKSNILQLADSRKTDKKQIWISGCSISHGVGVDLNQRYGQLLSEDLDLPVSFLTNTGSSVIWAADQLLRSDIQPNDLVVWGLTSVPRVSWFNNNKLNHVTPGMYEKIPSLDRKFSFEYFTSEDIMYRTITSMFQVINYCDKIKANLLLVSLMDDGTLFTYLNDFPNLLQIFNLWGRDFPSKWIDVGTDAMHPGPKSHKFYSDEILNKIKQLQWI